MTSGVNIRELVLDILMEVNEKEQYSHLVIREVLNKYQYLEKTERAFLTRLAEGTLEHQMELDFIINSFSKVKVAKMKPLIRNLLRMSVYQIKYMDAIPDSAVCNEAVKLAKKRGFGQLRGFVNGVLRSIVRDLERLEYPDPVLEPEAYLEVTYSIPRRVVSMWIADYGFEKTKAICEGFYKETFLTVRTNLSKTTPEALKSRLEEEGIVVHTVEGLPYAFALEGIDHLTALKSFRDGWFYVQDISSMMVAETAAPKSDDHVIDVCAAPGGKATHIAEKLNGTGLVEARDLTEYKVSMIEENIRRCGLGNMKATVMDATVTDPLSADCADVLICDLPCSGLGVLGRKTDIRYKMTEDKMHSLVELQRQILEAVHSYVKCGGTLVYSTCTIHREENEGNVAWFLEKYPQFTLVSEKQIFPGEEGQDGFFIAKLKRNV